MATYGRPNIILGAMEHGRRLNEQEARKMTLHFLQNNFREIDTAYVYTNGNSEKILGRMRDDILIPNNALISTKIFPGTKATKFGFSPKGMLQQFDESLRRLQTDCIDILYLHFPDPSNSLLSTLKVINELYVQKKIKRFGLSNFSSWQVTEIVYLCDKYNYIKPTVYQGMYNAITRDVERELLFCLKRFNIKFYAYNIIAGGVLSGKHKFEDIKSNNIQVGRFKGPQAEGYRYRYWQSSKFEAVKIIQDAIDKYNKEYNDKLTILQASLRWIMHHSWLTENDGVILGASSFKHYSDNLEDLMCDKPLSTDIVRAFDLAWNVCSNDCVSYIGFHKEPWNDMKSKL
eukprot:282522_1